MKMVLNGSNWVQRELRNLQAKKLLTSMTRLIEDASCGSKRGSQILWSLLVSKGAPGIYKLPGVDFFG